MQVPEPRPNWLTLRWRMFGTLVRVQPLFWVAAGAAGWGYYAEPDQGGAGLFALWVVCAWLSFLLHEFAHVVAARAFGARPRIVLYGLGGLTFGLEELKRRWPAVVALSAGP